MSTGRLKPHFLDIYLITFLGVRYFGNTSAPTVTFFWKYSKFNLFFGNPEKNREKVFCFWENNIWIGFGELFLLRRKYFSLTVNVLTNSLKILHSTRRDIFQLNYLKSAEKDGKGAIVPIGAVFGPIYHVACGRVLLNRTF